MSALAFDLHPDPQATPPATPNPVCTQAVAAGSQTENCQPSTDNFAAAAAAPRAHRNRANAAHSTGPRTAEGKARSSRNALRHGLSLPHHAILEWEDPAEFAQLCEELREIYQPLSKREDLAVEEIAKLRWAIRRCDEAENHTLSHLISPTCDDHEDDIHCTPGEGLAYSALGYEQGRIAKAEDDMERWPSVDLILRYRATHERRLERAIREFDRARQDRRREETHTLRTVRLNQQIEAAEQKAQDRRARAQADSAAAARLLAKNTNLEAGEPRSPEPQPRTENQPSAARTAAARNGFVPSLEEINAMTPDQIDAFLEILTAPPQSIAANATATPGFVPSTGA